MSQSKVEKAYVRADMSENFSFVVETVAQHEPVFVSHESTLGALRAKEGSITSSSLSRMFVKIPATIAVIIEVIARYKVNIQPNMPYVAIMESTPVIGVEIRKESVAPLDAPDFLMEVARGMTPHEHIGRGMPNNVDFKTDFTSEEPKCLVTMF
jgi:hypothetical protein